MIFPMGRLLITPGAQAILSADEIALMLSRHQKGDWGIISDQDKEENELSLQQGWRLMSAYRAVSGETIWVITEADRSATTVLLPDEY